MKIRHPRDVGIAIDVNGEHVLPDENGHYDIGDQRGWLERYADAVGVAPEDLIVDETATCETVKTDGEVCGRELPCAYHSEDDTDDDSEA
jgi:hypothetical protein